MKSFRTAIEGSFITTASFLVALVVAGLTIKAWGWNAGNVASWVQAGGSIAAIVGAYIIGERQAKATLRATQEAHELTEKARLVAHQSAERARRDGMLSVIRAAKSFADVVRAALDDPTPPLRALNVYHPSIIDSLVELMSKLPIHEFGSDRAIGAFVIFSGQFTFLQKAMAEYMAGAYTDEIKRQIEKLKKQGYGNGIIEDPVQWKQAALRQKVEVHLDRINSEFESFLAVAQKND